jgi:pimeloyl-ACP methyl ester carboxylesterase
MPVAHDFHDAAAILRRRNSRQFPNLSDTDWLRQARRTWKQDGDKLVPDYDPKLAETLAAFNPAQPVPTLWPQFDALAGVPVMVIRGANSDILSATTVGAMAARRPDMVVLEVADEGHVPALDHAATVEPIVAFLRRCDERLART